jgi:hypothetical protein
MGTCLSLRASSHHITALPMNLSPPAQGRSQGSRLHCPSASSYTSTDSEPGAHQLPPVTMTQLPIAAHAKQLRGSCIGGRGSHRASSPSKVNASHDDVVVAPEWISPPNTAKRPSPSTHALAEERPRLCMPGKYFHCQPASLGDPCSDGSSTCADQDGALRLSLIRDRGGSSLKFAPTQTMRPSPKRAAERPLRCPW